MAATERTYEIEIEAWRQSMDEKLRAETGWLTLTGLYWLHEGQNSLGSDQSCDIILPESAPQQLGFIDFHDQQATLHLTTSLEVLIDGVVAAKTTRLRDDSDPFGASRVEIDSVNFFIIRRSDQYAVRVRDRNHPGRRAFNGRVWFPIDPAFRVTAAFTPHPQPKTIDIVNVVGLTETTKNPGYVDFTLHGQSVRLEAFDGGQDQLWFVFRDSSPLTYAASRFLYAPLNSNGTATLDFNKAYNPPCAFTPYATCLLPPKQNILALPLEAGEKIQPASV
ncbi:MAG: DUF1684 domain-containing protein [Chloroflexi bacterium]|nr:DUF1684 domain-containing protein [Chloroflexota bacterium]